MRVIERLIVGALLSMTTLFAPLPAFAAISVETIGEGYIAGPAAGLVQSTPLTLSAGDTIIEICSNYVGTGNPFTTNQFSVGAGNTLTPILGPTIGTGTTTNIGVWACTNCNAETSNKFNCQTTGGSGNYLSMTVIALKGVPSSASIDVKELSATASTTAPSYTSTAATAQVNEMAIGAISGPGGSGAATEASGWTNATDTFNIPGGVLAQNVGYKPLFAIGHVTYNPTTASANAENILVITVKDVNPGSAANSLLLSTIP